MVNGATFKLIKMLLHMNLSTQLPPRISLFKFINELQSKELYLILYFKFEQIWHYSIPSTGLGTPANKALD